MARGQSGSLFLSLYDSFIHYSTPVYPDANRNRLSYLVFAPAFQLAIHQVGQAVSVSVGINRRGVVNERVIQRKE